MQQVWQDPNPAESITLRLKPNVEEFGQHERTFAKFIGGGTDEGQNENPDLLPGMDQNRKWFAGPIIPNSTWPHRKYFVMADKGDSPIFLDRLEISLAGKGVEIETWAAYWGRRMKDVENYLTLRRESGHTVVVDLAEVEKARDAGGNQYEAFLNDLAAKLDG